MTPVSLTMLQGSSEGPIARPPTPPVPFSPTPFETPPILPSTGEVNENTEGDLVTQQTSEVEQILQDLENGVVDETLPRLTEEDVAFDMDEVVVDEVVGLRKESDRHVSISRNFAKSGVTKCDLDKIASVWPEFERNGWSRA